MDAIAESWTAIPLAARQPFDVLRKPEGQSHTIWSLFAGFFLDRSAGGRHLGPMLTPEIIEAELGAAFGKRAPALMTRLLAKSATIERQLGESAKHLAKMVDRANAEAGDDVDDLATLGDIETMGPSQKTWVRVMVYSAMRALRDVEEDASMAEVLGNASQMKAALVKMPSTRGPVLTEDAWDAITAETDTKVLRFLLALVMLDAREIHAHAVQRALLEHEGLRRHAVALGHDEGEMQAVKAMIEEARAKEQGEQRQSGDERPPLHRPEPQAAARRPSGLGRWIATKREGRQGASEAPARLLRVTASSGILLLCAKTCSITRGATNDR